MPRSSRRTAPVQSEVPEAPSERTSRGPSTNLVILLGRLVADPEVRVIGEGKPVSKFRMATNDGPEPEFHDCAAFGRTAELVGEYLKKGSLIQLEGRLHSHSWEAEDGSRRRQVEIIARQVQFLTRSA